MAPRASALAAARESDGAVSSVANAARMLREFGVDRAELGVSELARRLSIGKSTAHRLLTTLVREQLVEQDPANGRYRLSVVVHELGLSVPVLRTLHVASSPVLDAVRTRTQQTVLLGVLRGRHVVIIERADSGFGIALYRQHGSRVPAHCTAVGKVQLAEVPDDELNRLFGTPAIGCTEWPRGDADHPHRQGCAVDLPELRRELAEIRSRGWTATVDEAQTGVSAVGAPVRAPGTGRVVAGLTVVLPTSRLTDEVQRNLGALIVEAASTVSSRLADGQS